MTDLHINQTKLPPFDELMALARNSPDVFDALKRELCEEAILSASPRMQLRLRAQQSHIDRLVARGKNPYHTIVILTQELYDQLERFRCALYGENIQSQTAEVIPLYPSWKS